MTVLARNPVHSVLWLILAFFSAAGLFVLLGAEFVAMLLAIVYVGAVAVLFLFVVMMLDVNFAELRARDHRLSAGRRADRAGAAGSARARGGVLGVPDVAPQMRTAVAPIPTEVENTRALGRLVYTDYVLLFQLAGMILLVAMIGAIVLTLRHKAGIKRQNVHPPDLSRASRGRGAQGREARAGHLTNELALSAEGQDMEACRHRAWNIT